jgi:lipopolysaccharide/colanic/teichoic acid biosynthesis glycosyltransferase
MVKRLFDIILSLLCLVITGWIILFFYVAIILTTGQNGFFLQERIGRYGKKFTIFKLKSMADTPFGKKISPIGTFIRKYKIDEFPQFLNILIGDMSFVGPRPDVAGYYDALQGEERCLLELRPGLTGPATIKYAREEELLSGKEDPIYYNDNVIFPDKVNLNMMYYKNRSFFLDLKLLFNTFLGRLPADFAGK